MANHQLLSVGNALVDILASGTDAFLAEAGVAKGAMTLVGEGEAARIYGLLGPSIETSGGSAANTAAGFVALGGSCVYVGSIGDDVLGEVFSRDVRAQGVTFAADARAGSLTGRSVIVVTPEGERSMSTHLGACTALRPSDVDPAFELLAPSGIVFLEGYLWSADGSRETARHAAATAASLLHPVALTLSDPSCAELWRDEFSTLVSDGTVGLVFANEKEFAAFVGKTDLDEGFAAAASIGAATFVVTLGSAGCAILHGDGAGGRTTTRVSAAPVDAVVDTTGAGDMFAAGYLRGVAAGLGEEQCARLGAAAAAAVIRRTGARAVFDAAETAAFDAALEAGAAAPSAR